LHLRSGVVSIAREAQAADRIHPGLLDLLTDPLADRVARLGEVCVRQVSSRPNTPDFGPSVA
jgi:hypothetical protein